MNRLYSKEAEQSVLGIFLLHNEQLETVGDLVKDDFYYEQHRIIYSCMLKMNGEIDTITIGDELDKINSLDDIGGMQYLNDIQEQLGVITLDKFRQYLEIVKVRSKKRQLVDICSLTIETINDEELSSSLNNIESNVQKLSQSETNDNIKCINALLKDSVERIDTLFNSDSDITGINTGFNRLNDATSGLQPADLIIIAARPSMGKSAFAMNICENIFMSQSKPVIVFSLEMPAHQLTSRMLSSIGRIDASRVRDGKLEEDDWPKLASATNRMKNRPIFIDDSASISPNYIRTQVRKIEKEHGATALIMVDYLQLMSLKGFKEGRVGEVSEISRQLKAIAKEFNCPVIALSQLNRSLEQRPNKRPINSDLRESGAIEQDADLILFIYRDEYYNPDTDQKGVAEIIIGKNRNGETGQFDLAFINRFVRFDNLATGDYEN